MDTAPAGETYDHLKRSTGRFFELDDLVETKLGEKGEEYAQQYRVATAEFVKEAVTLRETQAKLESILQVADDASLRGEFAAFLDAPLETDEQQAAARAALSHILGDVPTCPYPENYKVITEFVEQVRIMAGKIWRSDIPQFHRFLHRFRHPSERISIDEEVQKRKDLLEMAAPYGQMQELLAELWKVQDDPVWGRSAWVGLPRP